MRASPRLVAALALAGAIAIVVMLASRPGVPAPHPHRSVTAPVSRLPAPAVIPVRVRFGLWNELFPVPTVRIRVGHGPLVPVVLDTGSTGLHLYAAGVRVGRGSGVVVSSHADRIQYVDGSVQSGVLARARITLGHITTRVPVIFGLIDDLSCVKVSPNCPGAGGIRESIARGLWGVLGIGLRRDPAGTDNPLRGMPGAYGRAWSIVLSGRRGQLSLGRTAAPSLARIRLPRERSLGRHQPTWDDTRGTVCWGAAGLLGRACEPTLFDSGNSVGVFWLGRSLLAHAARVPGTHLLAPGTYIAAWSPGSAQPFWGMTTEDIASRNAVRALPARRSLVQVPVEIFFKRTVSYDAAHGVVLISRR